MLELIIKGIIEYSQQQKRAAAERARVANLRLAPPAPVETRNKKRKKHRDGEAVAVPAQQPSRAAARKPEALPVLESAESHLPHARDPRRMFILSEIVGPPLSLRDDEEL